MSLPESIQAVRSVYVRPSLVRTLIDQSIIPVDLGGLRTQHIAQRRRRVVPHGTASLRTIHNIAERAFQRLQCGTSERDVCASVTRIVSSLNCPSVCPSVRSSVRPDRPCIRSASLIVCLSPSACPSVRPVPSQARSFRWSVRLLLVRQHVRLSVRRPFVLPFIRLSVHPFDPSVHMFVVRSSVHPSVRPSVCSSVCPSVRPFARSSARPSVHPSVRPSSTAALVDRTSFRESRRRTPFRLILCAVLNALLSQIGRLFVRLSAGSSVCPSVRPRTHSRALSRPSPSSRQPSHVRSTTSTSPPSSLKSTFATSTLATSCNVARLRVRLPIIGAFFHCGSTASK